VNYVESSAFGDSEAEYLWAPYSAFTVQRFELSAERNYLSPHRLTVTAAIDNRFESEDLPLAQWY
jgi:hypothetical protein